MTYGEFWTIAYLNSSDLNFVLLQIRLNSRSYVWLKVFSDITYICKGLKGSNIWQHFFIKGWICQSKYPCAFLSSQKKIFTVYCGLIDLSIPVRGKFFDLLSFDSSAICNTYPFKLTLSCCPFHQHFMSSFCASKIILLFVAWHRVYGIKSWM